jgi:hypothetical protein
MTDTMQPPDPSRPFTAVCVSGMHRCGTSSVAGALRFLDVSLGDPDRMMRPGPDNPAGYFEVQAIMELDDEVLAHLGGAWDQPPVLEPGWEGNPSLDQFRARASHILDDMFGESDARSGLIAWKDPRLSLLLPFWRTVAPIATTIVMVRDPREVTASLAARRYSVAAPQAASLWLRYVFAAAASDPGHLMLRYNDLFENLPGTLSTIARHLGLPAVNADVEVSVQGHLDPALRHHVATESGHEPDNPLMELALAVWNGGDVNLKFVPPVVADGLARGWFRPPMDGELLARARADVVALRETLRQRNRQLESRTQSVSD